MNIVIVGGGKIGYYLVKMLLPNKHKICVLELKKDLCEKIANEFNITVMNGDGTSIDDLSSIETEKADIFIAVTGKDENNLIACQLAKRNFGVRRTISRINNPKNMAVFERLGVDITVSSTSIIADLIEQEIDYSGIRTLTKLKGDRIVLSEILMSPNSIVNGKQLKDINLPGGCILISVIRDEEVIIPNGFTTLQAGDMVIAVSSQDDQVHLKNYFI